MADLRDGYRAGDVVLYTSKWVSYPSSRSITGHG
jgi:hypothetical protein